MMNVTHDRAIAVAARLDRVKPSIDRALNGSDALSDEEREKAVLDARAIIFEQNAWITRLYGEKHFNALTNAEAERLTILAEEAGEIVQAVSKALRHGLDFHHPSTGETNRAAIMREIGDLNAICARMVKAGDITPAPILAASDDKDKKLPRWTHHQPDSEMKP